MVCSDESKDVRNEKNNSILHCDWPHKKGRKASPKSTVESTDGNGMDRMVRISAERIYGCEGTCGAERRTDGRDIGGRARPVR